MLQLVKYILSFVFLGILTLFLIDQVLLPLYVGAGKVVDVPEVAGSHLDYAQNYLHKLGLNSTVIDIKFNPEFEPGVVLASSPTVGTRVKKGRTITLSVNADKEDFPMPDLITKTIRNAQLEIERLGMVIDTVMENFSSSYEVGTVSFQSPRAGQMTQTGATVALEVSRGAVPDEFRVPNLYDLSLRKAKEKIRESGLLLGSVVYKFEPDLLPNTVIDQSQPAGLKLRVPINIDLIISSDIEEELY